MTKLFNPRVGVVPGFNLKREEWLNPFDRMLDEMMSTSNPELQRVFGDSVFEKSAYPKVNIIDASDHIMIEASVPGMRKEDISIDVEGQTLTISSVQSAEQREERREQVFLRREIKKSAFTRSFLLSKDLNLDKVSADIDAGLLSVRIPKLMPNLDKAQKKKIQIG